MFRTVYEQIEYAGFILLEYDDGMFIIREQSDDSYEVYMDNVKLDEYTTVDEAVEKARIGIAKMTKLNESAPPSMSPSDWVKTELGIDFVAEILYRTGGSGQFRKYDIGVTLRDFGILATSTYIEYFTGLLNGQGVEVK